LLAAGLRLLAAARFRGFALRVGAFDLAFFAAVLVSAIRLSSSCGFPPEPIKCPDPVI